MPKNLLIALSVGLAVVGAIVAFSVAGTEDMRLTVETELRKVRTLETSPQSSLALFDFRLQNKSNVPFVLKEVKIYLLRADGSELEGDPQPRETLDRMIAYFPQSGGKINEVLIPSDKIGPKALLDRMVGASFSIPVSALEERKGFRVELVDLDGGKFVINEKRK